VFADNAPATKEAKMASSPDGGFVPRGRAWALLVGLAAVLILLLLTVGQGAASNLSPEAVKVIRVWDVAPSNAFTDLILFRNRFFLAFREANSHDSMDGKIRVLMSLNGSEWESAAVLAAPLVDLRDPKFSITPGGKLMLNAAAAQRNVSPTRYQSLYWASSDGRTWTALNTTGNLNYWMWRVAWEGSQGYSVAYRTTPPYHTTLYAGNPEQGIDFSPVISPLVSGSYANETVLLFRSNADLLALTRRDPIAPYTTTLALMGKAVSPYTSWSWSETNYRLGGPDMLELADGRIVVAARVYTPSTHTGLLWLDPDQGTLTEFLQLTSGGDTGYPGLVMRNGVLFVSYYSSHEGKPSIYLAKMKLP
jgi:hypothetical protein